MMKRLGTCAALAVILWSLQLSLGCARVRVEAPKDPIKLDITMRLDVYQHVQSDIDSIENLVSGGDAAKPAVPGPQGFLGIFVTDAYAQHPGQSDAPVRASAQEAVSPATQDAALRRKDRLEQVRQLLASGALGENAVGLLSARDPSLADAAARNVMNAENSDRMVIYREIAAKNSIPVDEVQRMYARRLQNDAPAGAPIEVDDGTGSVSWKVK
jgi:uncharacterized protein YdbL (DUF1318 family)